MGRLPPGAIAGERASRQSRLVHDPVHDPPHTRRSARPQARTLYLGMDVQKEAIAVASVSNDHDAEGVSLGTMGTRPCDMAQLVRQRQATATSLVFGDDAGPWGDWLSRALTPNGHACGVVAPALIPQKAGDRVHTDRRDAVPRARLVRSGDLTPVSVPTGEDEAMRDRSRARAATLRDLNAATFRRNAFWLRQDSRSPGRTTWGPAPLQGRAAVVCPTPAQPMGFQEDVRAVPAHPARLPRLAQARLDPGHPWRLQPVVEALPARRGVQCIVAVPRVADLGDLSRVENPRPLMNYLGLIPADDARGERRRQGPITPAGNTQARRALVEGAWAYRSPAHVSRPRQLRWEPLPQPSHASRGKAHVRRCPRLRRRRARRKHAHHGVVAMARELVGLLGAMAKQVPVTPEVHQTDHPRIHHAVSGPRRAAAAPPRGGATLDGVT